MAKSLRFVIGFVICVTVSCSRGPEQYLKSGDSYFAQKKYDDAVIQYGNAVLKSPLLGEARFKLAEAYHAVGIRCEKPGELDEAIGEMIKVDRPVIFDCVVDLNENCFPMIPSGRAHNEMILGDAGESVEDAITEAGKVMV